MCDEYLRPYSMGLKRATRTTVLDLLILMRVFVISVSPTSSEDIWVLLLIGNIQKHPETKLPNPKRMTRCFGQTIEIAEVGSPLCRTPHLRHGETPAGNSSVQLQAAMEGCRYPSDSVMRYAAYWITWIIHFILWMIIIFQIVPLNIKIVILCWIMDMAGKREHKKWDNIGWNS